MTIAGPVPVALCRFPKHGGWSSMDSYKMLGQILRSKMSTLGTLVEFLSGRCSISDMQLQQILEGLNFKQMA
jgi:hypothetical protein